MEMHNSMHLRKYYNSVQFNFFTGVVGWCEGAGLTSSAGASY